MQSRFTVGQRVRILPIKQLVELERNGADIAEDMFEYGGKETTILNAHNNLVAYYLDIDEGEWVWYDNLLEPIK